LHGAFAEYEALAVGTKCREPLYSLSINPASAISRDQYLAAIARIERRLGLVGQPRAVIFHIKQGTGREHCHVVWSRIDTAKMRAVQLSHDHMKLRTLAREIAHDYGLALPPGLAEDRDIDRFEAPDMTMAEKAQAEQSGIAPDERRADITAAYRSADSPVAFCQALGAAGYVLARGDRRAYVVVDRYGHVHSLARQIDGVRTRDLKTFLGDVPVLSLEEAQEQARRLNQATEDPRREQADRQVAAALALLRRRQAVRRLAIYRVLRQQRAKYAREAEALVAAQQAEAQRPAARIVKALRALFARLPVLRTVLSPLRRRANVPLEERHRIERAALSRRHDRERRDLQRRQRMLRNIERRERQAVARSVLRSLRARDHKHEMFVANAHDVTSGVVHQIDDQPIGFDPAELELDRLYALLDAGLTPTFNENAGVAAQARVGDSAIAESLDAEEAALEREYALLEHGLSPQFNSRAGIERRVPSEDDQGIALDEWRPNGN
jgi:hypothetical protein